MEKDGENYAITITFATLRSNFPKQQFRETITYVTKTLKQSTSFIIVPEWRITNGSIHYHGTIHIFDKVKWYKSTLPSLKKMGYCLIKKIDNYDKWNSYLAKEQCVAQGILGEDYFLPIYRYIENTKEASAKLLKGGLINPSIYDYIEEPPYIMN